MIRNFINYIDENLFNKFANATYPSLIVSAYGDPFGRPKQDLRGGKKDPGIKLNRH